MLMRRKKVAATLACLLAGVAAAGVTASAGSLTNEERVEKGIVDPSQRAGATRLTNEQALERGRTTLQAPPSSSAAGRSNDR
ncbi:MAG: hypothetical protein ACRDGE_01430 [Candidatus Limnocylindria bacterium]